MLWTDQDFVTANDLASIDPEVPEIAAAESIILEGPDSVCRRGIEEAGSFLERKLVTFASFASGGELSSNHLSAVHNVGGQSVQHRKFTVEQIVVSGRNQNYWSELKKWVAYVCLRQLYRTAMNRATNDRYEHKHDRFHSLIMTEAWPTTKKIGIPVVRQPLPCPEAVQGFDPGTFSVSAVAGSGTAGERYVCVSYVDSTKYIVAQNPCNGESHVSVPKIVTTSNSQVVSVDITNLKPPTGALTNESRARGFSIPREATHWNVYSGLSLDSVSLQNASPIPLSTKTYVFSGDPSSTGPRPGLGQYPEIYLTIMDTLQRS